MSIAPKPVVRLFGLYVYLNNPVTQRLDDTFKVKSVVVSPTFISRNLVMEPLAGWGGR